MNLKQFAADPLAFFNALVIPSAFGNKPFSEVMADHQRDWFQAIAPSLIALAKGEAPPIGRFWSERTKGGSKDSDCGLCLLWLLAFSRQSLDMQTGAADRDQAAELKKAMTDVLNLNPWLKQRIEVQQWALKCLANNCSVDILASDVAGSHGARPDVVVLNELSHVTKEEFAQNLLDNASKKPNGLVVVMTNAGFCPSWQWDWREMASESNRWNFHALSEPAPWLSDDELEEAERRNSKSRFRRLFWGEWPSSLGDALDADDIKACIDDRLRPVTSPGPTSTHFYVGGLDIGIRQDHSALVVLEGRRDTQLLRLAFAKSWKPDPITKQVDLMDVEKSVLDLHRKFNDMYLAFDPWQASLLAQRLQRQGKFSTGAGRGLKTRIKEVAFTGKALNEMASTLLEIFRSRRIRLYTESEGQAIIDQLGQLTLEEKSYGYRLVAPRTQSGGHCDLAIALSIALPLAVEESAKRGTIWLGADDTYNPDLTPTERQWAEFEERKKRHEQDQLELLNRDPEKERKSLASGAIFRHLYPEY